MKNKVETRTPRLWLTPAQKTNQVQPRRGIGSPVVLILLVVTLLTLIPGFARMARADHLHGLQLHVEFEDNVVDSSLNGFDGQASGDLQYAEGVVGQAAIFDGIDDVVLFPTFLDALMSDNDFTVAFWFNMPMGSLRSVLSKREICAVHPFFDVRMSSKTSHLLEVGDPVETWGVRTPAATAGWHHVAFTRTGTEYRAFLDGELVDQDVTPVILDFSNTALLGVSSSPCIGADGTQMLEGSLDDLRIYNRALTDIEIATLEGSYLFGDDFESGDLSAWSNSFP